MSLKRIDRTFLGKIKGRANGKGGFFFMNTKCYALECYALMLYLNL